MDKIEALKIDCQLKTKNLQNAIETVKRGDFINCWQLENYLSCVEDVKISISKLAEYLNTHPDGTQRS